MDSAVKSSQIAALDIGTAKISVVVADVDDTGEIRVVGIGKVEFGQCKRCIGHGAPFGE